VPFFPGSWFLVLRLGTTLLSNHASESSPAIHLQSKRAWQQGRGHTLGNEHLSTQMGPPWPRPHGVRGTALACTENPRNFQNSVEENSNVSEESIIRQQKKELKKSAQKRPKQKGSSLLSTYAIL